MKRVVWTVGACFGLYLIAANAHADHVVILKTVPSRAETAQVVKADSGTAANPEVSNPESILRTLATALKAIHSRSEATEDDITAVKQGLSQLKAVLNATEFALVQAFFKGLEEAVAADGQIDGAEERSLTQILSALVKSASEHKAALEDMVYDLDIFLQASGVNSSGLVAVFESRENPAPSNTSDGAALENKQASLPAEEASGWVARDTRVLGIGTR